MAQPPGSSEEPTNGSPPTASPIPSQKRHALPKRIFIGLIIGVVGGLACNALMGAQHDGLNRLVNNVTEPIGQLFLRLLLLLVVPLVFSSLVVGVAALGDIRKLGRIGIKSFGYCLVISAISVAIALTLTNIIQPGKRIDDQTALRLQQRYSSQARRIEQAQGAKPSEPVLLQLVKTIVPSNPISAVATETPNMLHLMFFSLLIGVGITLLPKGRAETFVAAADGLFAISARLIDWVMHLAPFAVACLVFSNLALFGLDLLGALAWFFLTVLSGLALHMFGVYSILIRWLSKISPLEFFRRIKLVMLTAFSTSSSNATLPTTLRVAEENLGVPRDIGGFVLTLGASANQNGTALYEGVTVLFLAQLAGIDLSLGQQLIVAYLAILGSIGTAGVPSGSIPFILLVLANLQINTALIAIILGVDRFLDMCRTVVNVTGDLAAATYVARSEGHHLKLDHETLNKADVSEAHPQHAEPS
jgi:DAACS family dicarboxylate/amino acid:cation (Na+ or H+) symporter